MKIKPDVKKKNSPSCNDLDLTVLMSNLPGMVYRCRNDEDWTMEYVSDGCRQLTGFRAEQLIENAYISYGGLIHPEDRYKVWTDVNQGIENKTSFRIIYRIIADGGEEKWVFEQGQGIFDEKQNLLAIEGFITDVSEQKQAELELKQLLDEKKLILSEIHHRIKNNMQQIISMLSVQAAIDPDCSGVLNAVIERITIFSEMHQDLYRYDNRDLVNLTEHINRNLNNLLMSYNIPAGGVELKLDIPDGSFEFDTAIPLGLMLNELFSNSLKHAFGPSGGWIRVIIRKSADGGVERMEYSDSGSDMGEASGGFGVLLLEAFASQIGLQADIVSEGNTKYIFSR